MAKNTVIKKTLFAVLALIIVLSSFYVLDFKAAQSETRVNSAVSAYSTGSPKIDFPGKIYLYVEGEDSVSEPLKEKLKTELEKEGMDVSVVDTLEEKYDSQALLVNISMDDALYTPLYATSNLNILFFYTSSGKDAEYFEKFKKGGIAVVFEKTDSWIGEKLIRGDMELQDSTKGLISQKAYGEHLGTEAAKAIASRLEQNIRDLS